MKSRHPAGTEVPSGHTPGPLQAGKPAVAPETAATGAFRYDSSTELATNEAHP
jgi:hypothetical protein